MKKRQGFVSNSSSSSFIIAVDSSVKNEDVKIEISISEAIEKRISNVKDLEAYYMEHYVWCDDEEAEGKTVRELLAEEGDYMVEEYDKCMNALASGQDIIFGSGSNEGDSAAELAIYYGAMNELDMEGVDVIQAGD